MTDRPDIVSVTDLSITAKTPRIVMLVEDSEIDRLVYQRYLQTDNRYCYTFVEAETGEQGLKLYQQHQPDLVLLDYALPDIDGLEWLEQLQQHEGNPCPAIVLTGQGNENIAVQFIKIGAADYLVKGQITAQRLKHAVDKALYSEQLQQTNRDLIARLVARNAKLRRSNELYRQEISKREKLQEIVAKVPAIIYAKEVDPMNRQTGKLWLVNQEFQNIFAIAESDAIGKTDRELFPPEIAANLAANDRLVIERKQPLTTEEQVYHADGELHTYLSLKFPLLDEHGEVTAIVGVANDITTNRQAQIELLESEAKFRSTFAQAAVGMAHVSPDGKWLKVNQKLCQIIGYTERELLLTTFQDLTYPDDLNKDLRYVRQMLAGEIQTYSLEKRYIHQSGEPIWINLTVSLVRDVNGQPSYFISVIEDIQERKKLELTLTKSLRRLSNLHKLDKAILAAAKPEEIAQTAIETIQNSIGCQRTSIATFDWERETSTILATQGLTNNTINKWHIPLSAWHELIEQLRHEGTENYLAACLSKLPALSELEIALAPTELECFIAFPLQSQKNFLGILQLWIDNSQEITTEEIAIVSETCGQLAIALQQARLYKQTKNYAIELEHRVAQRTAQLEDINRELKAFTYTISHDLKAPLRAIQGFATALQEDYEDLLDDLGQDYTARLVASARQMTQLIEDLLAYSRLSRTEIQLRPIELGVVVARVVKQFELEIEQTEAKIEIEIAPDSMMVGNKIILVQLVSNLLSNALKFVSTTTRPQICIRTEEVKNSNSLSSQKIRLWVEDNGIGISPEHQERIFQVFERLHGNEAYPGTGIGLAIVKKGIERLGGKFGVESQVNRGSRFWLEGKASTINH